MGAIIFVLGSGVSTQEVEWKAQLILGLTLDLKFIQSLLNPFPVTALGRKCLLASSSINRLYSDSLMFFLCWCVEGVRETERHKIQRRCAPGSPFTQKRLSVPRRREPPASSVRSREERSYSVLANSSVQLNADTVAARHAWLISQTSHSPPLCSSHTISWMSQRPVPSWSPALLFGVDKSKVSDRHGTECHVTVTALAPRELFTLRLHKKIHFMGRLFVHTLTHY